MKATIKKGIITQGARKIFSRYGFLKTTVEEIAKAARMGKASLYHYFESKEDIFREVVEQEHRFLTEKIQEEIRKVDAPQKKISAYVKTRTKHLNELANIHSALKDDYLDHYAFIEEIRERNFRQEIETIQAILKEGVQKGVFVIRDIKLTSFSIISALKGLEYPWTVKTPLPEVEKNIDKLLDVLFNGIVKRYIPFHR